MQGDQATQQRSQPDQPRALGLVTLVVDEAGLTPPGAAVVGLLVQPVAKATKGCGGEIDVIINWEE